ncbi:prolyl oligopeptidase family serine peptidase [Streptomyces sp. NPDC089799]|uniref:prolyl oligopeptidase family serine peptidase n=1 Tax=Streptomyces sp. NPDC089799 TaxID=3155066 RepID=UPI0034419956
MTDTDPYLWLEDVTGEAALAWVRERNAETSAAFTSGPAGPAFARLTAEVREVLDDPGRIPYLRRRGPYAYSFWQDRDRVRGVWRRTPLARYDAEDPGWEVLLDLDALAAEEGEDWVWAGADVLFPGYGRALVRLSRGGGDAVTVREFDLSGRCFVADGFRVPEARTTIGWIDADTVFVGTDFGEGSLTASGYPRTVRRWRRGTPLHEAVTVYEAAERDVSAAGWRDPTPGFERDFVIRHVDFWNSELYLLDGDGAPVALDVPAHADKHVHRQWLLVTPRELWLGHPAGTLLAFGLDAYLAGGRDATVLFAPDERTFLTGYGTTRSHLVLETLADVSTRLEVLTPGPDGWARRPLEGVPPLSTATVTGTDPYADDAYFLDVTGPLQPATLYAGELGTAADPGAAPDSGTAGVTRTAGPPPAHRVVKRAPSHFDPAGLSVRQYFAESEDGTRVPYSVVGPEHRDGPGPALLYGYGGFEYSLTPSYQPVTGRAWLARGGTHVVANIRGGGEYGPAWHRAARGAGRVRSFQDFAAVARDLVARGLTTPGLLGIEGGSNGGLLVGAMLVRHPELFGAAVAAVPVLDLLRFHTLLAGASWTAEYGDPDDPADLPHLAALSPYHQAGAGRPYPPLLLLTSTRDDRVHPGHARKMAARLRELGQPVYFHEHTGGGHATASDHAQAAFNEALTHTFLWRHLGPPPGKG